MEAQQMSDVFNVTTIKAGDFPKLATALHPRQVPLEQSPIWGQFDDALAGRSFLGSFRYDDSDGTLVAIGSATLYRQKGRNWIWFKHGPIFAREPNTKTVQKMCATLQQQFAGHDSRPVFIRLSMPTFSKPLRLPYEHTMYDQTVIVDLTLDEAAIRAGMSQSGRRSLKKAEAAGLTVKAVPTKIALKEFATRYYPIMQETAQRDGFGSHPAKLYTTMLEKLSQHAMLYEVTKDKTLLAWAITTEYQTQAMYYYGASSQQARELHAPYLLHWYIMKDTKQRGNQTYDFMGIAGKHYPELANVTQFKTKFSKNIVTIPTTYDLPLRPLPYHLLSAALTFKRNIFRNR